MIAVQPGQEVVETMSGTGEIRDGKVHLHVVLGGEGDRTLAGHLLWARVQAFFVNAYVEPL